MPPTFATNLLFCMKNIITFLLSCLSLTAVIAQADGETRIEVLSQSPTETVLQLTLTGIGKHAVTTPRGEAFVVTMPKGTSLLQAGAPDVPKFAASLMIPATGSMAVEIGASGFQDFPNIEIAPSKGDLKRTVDPSKVPFEYGTTYERDAFFPTTLAALQQPFVMRDARGQAIWIQPVQYNPVSKVLRVYTQITLRVYHVGGQGVNELSAPARTKSRAFEQVYRQMFLNYAENSASRSAIEPDKMLVLTKDEFESELEPLVQWKRQMGIHTTVVTMSEVGSPAASNVTNFIQNYYAEHGISYVLLVGGEADINPEMRADGGLYSCDNCFGYMSGDDHFPEIFVGRFHAETIEQLRVMVNRNVEYEKNPLVDEASNWCGTAMASASNEGQGIGDDNQADYEHANEIKTNHLADGFEKVWEFYDGNHASTSPTPGDETADQEGNPVNTQLVDAMNTRGVSLYNYTGHGWEQGLVSGNFNTDAVSNLRNHGRYPICIAVACCSGNFTNNGGGDCLGEAFQRAGNLSTGEAWGGIAGFFSSDYQSWAPPMEGQDGMNEMLVNADGVTLTPSIGTLLAFGNARMITAYGSGGELMADFWNSFSEPSTVPRTRLPQAMIATHPLGVFIGASSLTVNCDVEGALVSLYWQGQTLAVAVVENGVAVLNFPALDNVGALTVTASQFNYLPYQGVIQVTPSEGAFVVNQSVMLNDAAGNSNLKADFGEAITFDVTLSNVGLEIANATSATLSATDPNVVITDGEESFGDIEASAVAEKTAAFAFTVSDDVADGHVVNFTLHIEFNDGQAYEVVVPVKVQAPKMTVGALSINDVAGGDGDLRLESGETATITVVTANDGHSLSPAALGALTTDSPWLTLLSGTDNLGTVAPDGSTSATFSVTVSPDAPQVVLANFYYLVTAGNYDAEKNFGPYTVNAILETFETHNFNSFDWEMGGNKPWIITSPQAYTGVTSARSGNITHNQTSVMNLTLDVTQAGTVSFARRVSSESEYDFLRFYIDNEELAAWSGEAAWSEVAFPITTGLHTLTWTYSKDEIVSEGQDRAWVDDVSLPPYQVSVPTTTPNAAILAANLSPNPAADQATLTFSVPTAQKVSVEMFDCLGRAVRTAQTPEWFQAGRYALPIRLEGLQVGVYLVQIRTESGAQVLKMVKN
jgi:gingipain R